mmetsp:Transcript_6635/g.10957  ORF Transcript_6635/g.10957 Transcript_6635/m.10957 type:complete len:108 (-) Transcript_6635:535-858(-)
MDPSTVQFAPSIPSVPKYGMQETNNYTEETTKKQHEYGHQSTPSSRAYTTNPNYSTQQTDSGATPTYSFISKEAKTFLKFLSSRLAEKTGKLYAKWIYQCSHEYYHC